MTTIRIKPSILASSGEPVVYFDVGDELVLLTDAEATACANMLVQAVESARETARLVAERPGALACIVANAEGRC